jgi:hypothetical protein
MGSQLLGVKTLGLGSGFEVLLPAPFPDYTGLGYGSIASAVDIMSTGFELEKRHVYSLGGQRRQVISEGPYVILI